MKMRKVLVLLMCTVLLLSLAACGASMSDMSVSNGAAKEEIYYSAENGVVMDSEQPAQPALPENRKLVQTMYLDTETEDLDSLLAAVSDRVNQMGGYIEAQKTYNGSAYSTYRHRYADLTIRIPAQKLGDFVTSVGEVSNIISSESDMDDITLTYVATESRMKALETEHSRLLELMEKAENLADLLTVEQRLTEVTAELEQVTSTLRLYDNQVDYATIHLNISEVREYTVVEEPETVWERISTGFMESLESVGDFFVELFVFFAANLPVLLIWAVVITGVIVLIRIGVKRKKKKSEPK